jgi:hypothetical protein
MASPQGFLEYADRCIEWPATAESNQQRNYCGGWHIHGGGLLASPRKDGPWRTWPIYFHHVPSSLTLRTDGLARTSRRPSGRWSSSQAIAAQNIATD